jgi:hypothetical protein
MASSVQEVQLILTLVQGHDDFPVRTVRIGSNSSVTVGRSSRDESKNLVASPDNLWLTGMIVSRSHASFSYQREDNVSFLISLLRAPQS